MQSDPTALIFMYFVRPIWPAVRFADWLCHGASNIAETTGAKASVKADPLPAADVVTLLGLIVLFELLPRLEELVRGLHINRGRLVPPAARALSE